MKDNSFLTNQNPARSIQCRLILRSNIFPKGIFPTIKRPPHTSLSVKINSTRSVAGKPREIGKRRAARRVVSAGFPFHGVPARRTGRGGFFGARGGGPAVNNASGPPRRDAYARQAAPPWAGIWSGGQEAELIHDSACSE